MTALPLDHGIRLLTKFAAREGHSRVPYDHVEDGAKLGKWVSSQRSRYQLGRICAERAAALEAVPGWLWRVQPADPGQAKAIAALRAYAAREGHAFAPRGHVEDGVKLGARVSYWRNRHRNGVLPQATVAALEAVPGWAWEATAPARRPRRQNTTHARLFTEGAAALAAFAAREGHCRVPRHHLEDGFKMGGWVDNRRKAYRNGLLTAEQIAELEAFPGWVWGPYDDRWVREYRLLAAHVEMTGDAGPRQGTIVDGVDIGYWASRQRHNGRVGHLSAERRAQLEAIPGWSWGTQGSHMGCPPRWDGWIARLEAFIAREGHCTVPQQHHEDGQALGAWVFSRRRDYRLGHLHPEAIARLDAVDGWEWRGPGDVKPSGVRDVRWQEGMTALRAFVYRTKSAKVPVQHVEDGYRLGAWVTAQRTAHRLGKLPAHRAAQLEGLNAWTWREAPGRASAASAVSPAPARRWVEGLAYLREFTAREGTSRVPYRHVEDGFGLGVWASRQRRAYRSGTLGRHLAKQLEAVPGWQWEPRRTSPAGEMAGSA